MPEQLPPIVRPGWLALNRRSTVLVDVRWYLDGRSGRAAYEAGHLVGAIYCDLDRDLSGPASAATGRHPLPAPTAFAASMSALGIGDGDAVVAYDDAGGTVAARLVWMLRAIGQAAALLDGGLGDWFGPPTREVHRRAPSHFTPRPWPAELLATIDEVAAPANLVLVDVRAENRYRGEYEPVDPRPGHIPGAVNLPSSGNVDPDRGEFLDAPALRARFAAAGVSEGQDVVVYCGSGVTACHTLLAMEEAGLGRGRLFPGSWSQWSADPERPGEPPIEPAHSTASRRDFLRSWTRRRAR